MGMLNDIRHHLDGMPPIQRKIAEYVLENSNDVVRMSISNLAKQSGAKSEASVVKFYRSFGFSGYHDFKVTLATEIAGQVFHNSDVDSRITADDDVSSIRKKIFQSAVYMLERNNTTIDDEILVKAVEMIEDAERVVVLGYGTSAVVAYDLFIKLSRLGINCIFTPDAHANALILSEPREKDLLFAISFSGESKDIVYQARQTKGFAPIVAMTGELSSPLAKIADLCIATQSYETSYHTDAMISRMVQIAVMDILFTALSVRRGDKALARLTRARQGLSFLKF
ncbi:MAG: MurR/RpiR family transcriptional regulator [Sphaerochaeta sp.]|jgi:RpiR family carbohydrate utilization transcriptional regulator